MAGRLPSHPAFSRLVGRVARGLTPGVRRLSRHSEGRSVLRWYLSHGYTIAGWLAAAATLLGALAYSRGLRRQSGRRPRRPLLWAAILLTEAGLHFLAWAIWTDPDATVYGTNWRGLALL